MPKAIVMISYEDENELNAFLSKEKSKVEVAAVYKDLDGADMEHIEDIVQRDLDS